LRVRVLLEDQRAMQQQRRRFNSTLDKDDSMKKFFYLFSGLGLVSILIIGIVVSSVRADNEKSPLRGAWSFSQFVPTVITLAPEPIPAAAAGTLFMDADNNFTGRAGLNTALPSPVAPVVELDFNGSCTFRPGGLKNGMDCTLDVPAFGLSDVGRFCVVMEARGECFDEFRCVNTTEAAVLLVEFKRQRSDTCQ
jgi:hypothetical protein